MGNLCLVTGKFCRLPRCAVRQTALQGKHDGPARLGARLGTRLDNGQEGTGVAGFDFASFSSRNAALGASLFSALPNLSASRGLLTAARASAAAQRSRDVEGVDVSNLEGKARLARQRAQDFGRLSGKLDRTVATVEKARDKLLELKEILSDMRKQIVLAQSGTIDDAQRRVHADAFDQLLGKLNIKVRTAGGSNGNIIGSSIRDVFEPQPLTYRTRPNGTFDQSVGGVFSGSDYVITDGVGDKFFPDLFGSQVLKFPFSTTDDGEIIADTDAVVFDADTGAISITHDGDASPFLTGTLERKGLGVLHSVLYGNFTDPALLDDALADLDAASAKLRFNVAVIEGQLTKVTAHRDFNAGLVEEHQGLASKVEQRKTLEETEAAFVAQREQLLFASAFQSSFSFNAGGSLLSLGVSSLFDFSA